MVLMPDLADCSPLSASDAAALDAASPVIALDRACTSFVVVARFFTVLSRSMLQVRLPIWRGSNGAAQTWLMVQMRDKRTRQRT